MLCSPHVDPVAMQVEADFLVVLRNKEWFEGARYGKVNARVHFLERTVEFESALSARNSVYFGRHDPIDTDFVLKRCANFIGSDISDFVSYPDHAAAFAISAQARVTIVFFIMMPSC